MHGAAPAHVLNAWCMRDCAKVLAAKPNDKAFMAVQPQLWTHKASVWPATCMCGTHPKAQSSLTLTSVATYCFMHPLHMWWPQVPRDEELDAASGDSLAATMSHTAKSSKHIAH